MRLYWSARSPYVRKVTVAADERGLGPRIERVPIKVSAFGVNEAMLAENPLGKIPTLVCDDGTRLFDSRVICEYLDGLGDAPRLFPAERDERIRALRWQAYGDGMLDMLITRLGEKRSRPSGQRSPELAAAIRAKIAAALDGLEREAGLLTAAPYGIGHVTVGCTLGYLDFRFAEDAWRDGRPALARWYEGFFARPAVQANLPVDA